eukprot:scaffold1120_cov127-Cylindrotheca_fusiformis.AAC.14
MTSSNETTQQSRNKDEQLQGFILPLRPQEDMRTATVICLLVGVNSFLTSPPIRNPKNTCVANPTTRVSSPSSLNVWWFGGTEQSEVNDSHDSCELVAVRIERTSPNSRRIAGEITIPCRLDEVWSILTDYDRLSIHVPNLMESKIKQKNGPGEPGDGSFRCRLYQVGAQKIIGFDFSASVTMDMTENVIRKATADEPFVPQEKTIGFKCVESQFFKEFDGYWSVKETVRPDGEFESIVSYVVDVRPKGPVPVAALEWRIREDVPTNLRAVKAATLGKQKQRSLPLADTPGVKPVRDVSSLRSRARKGLQSLVPTIGSDWDRDETMAKYL